MNNQPAEATATVLVSQQQKQGMAMEDWQ